MRRMAAALLLTALLAGCGGRVPDSRAPPPEVDARLGAASVAFGIDLLKEVYNGGNALLSPVSAGIVLSLTGAGARGETQAEFWEALRLDGLTQEEIQAGNRSLHAVLTRPDPKVEVSLANAVWRRPDVAVEDDFVDLARTYYGATVDEAEFGTPAGTARLNEWTDEATRGKIKKLLEQTTPDTVMVLANALYFKGAWSAAFDPQRTRGGTFTTAAGTERTVFFMERDGQWEVLGPGEAHTGEARVKGVRLPYGEGRIAMYLFVPDDLHRFIEDLTAERWAGLLEAFTPREGLVRVPRFRLELTHELNEPLQALGLRRAFDGAAADFAGIFGEGVRGIAITEVLQRTYMEVNEEGTEAAAATGVAMRESAPVPLMEVNRPFLLAVRDDESGALLFLGVVTDPA